MPDSYGICLTAVVRFGPSTALATSIPSATMIATRMNRKIGVNSVPMTVAVPPGPRPGTSVFVKCFTKYGQKN